MSNYLTQMLSQFSGATTNIQYIFPTIQNLSTGKYTSEILDVKDIVNTDGGLEALDFYHKLVDSNGNNLWVRFRYYKHEFAALAEELAKYPGVNTWQSTIALREDITVTPKATGNYMRISSRSASVVTESSASTASALSTGTSATKVSVQNRAALSCLGSMRGNKPIHTQRQVLICKDAEGDNDEFDDFLDESDE